MSKEIPISSTPGVQFLETPITGVSMVCVTDANSVELLPWDRYVRLSAVANKIKNLIGNEYSILDVGGYDGALALFMPGYAVDLIDPATTGASLLHTPVADGAYQLVAAVDVLEHIDPNQRESALRELARLSRGYVVLNYPCEQSAAAQQLVLDATNNSLIREHVDWPLPNTEWVIDTMQSLGFQCEFQAHSSVAVWLGQYLLQNLVPEVGRTLNKFLIESHADEPFNTPLYHLVVCKQQTSESKVEKKA